MSNENLVTFAAIISSGLIKPEEYIACCDDIIANEEHPSTLIIDLPLSKSEDSAAHRLLLEAYGNFKASYPSLRSGFFEVCAKFIKYKSRECSWENFLRSAIYIAGHDSCQWGVSDFERFLEAYLASGSSSFLAYNQSEHVAGVLKEEMEEIDFFRSMVEQSNLKLLFEQP